MSELIRVLTDMAHDSTSGGAMAANDPRRRLAVVNAILSSQLGSPPAIPPPPSRGESLDAESSERMQTVSRRFSSVMALWNPIGYSDADVEQVLGPPTERSGDTIEYRLDNGWKGPLWRFHLRGGIVSGVEMIPSR